MGEEHLLQDIHLMVGEINGKLGMVVGQIADLKRDIVAVEERTRTLENGRSWFAGACAVGGGVVGAALTAFGRLLIGRA
jgi:hypothetical protein